MNSLNSLDNLKFSYLVCCKCGVVSYVPERFKENLEEKHTTFYCPNGHPQWFPPPAETGEEKLQRRLDLEVNRRKSAESQADHFKRSAAAHKAAKTKLKKRAKEGVCPCCHRTFKQLQSHMKNKHPEFS